MAVAAIVFVAAVHIAAAVLLVDRSPHVDDPDESEFLQVGVKMARGERLYVDFFEHHPPFVFEALKAMAPASNDGVDAYLFRARLLMAVCGTIAFALAAFLVWRASGRWYAPVIFAGLLLASGSLWRRAFVDVRGEPPALALLLLGAVLMLIPRRAVLAGVGIGCVALAALINPKWPIVSVALGVIFLVEVARAGRKALLTAIAIGTAIATAGALLLVAMCDVRRFVDLVFVLTRHVFDWTTAIHIGGSGFHSPLPFQWLIVAAAALLVLCAPRDSFRDARLSRVFLVLLAAALLEIRFVYPFHGLGRQYYIAWGISAAALMALAPQALVALIERAAPRMRRAAIAIPVALTLLAMFDSLDALPLRRGRDARELQLQEISRQLRPGDTIWVPVWAHPIGAADASYYWFGFIDVVPPALQFAKTPDGRRSLPAITEADLPPCRALDGRDPHVRIVTARQTWLPQASRCVEQLRARGRLVPLPIEDLFLVKDAAR